MTSPSQSQPVSGPTAPVTEAEPSAAGMVERVARAIHAARSDPKNYAWFNADAEKCRLSRIIARAAIEAMREPTEGMKRRASLNAAQGHSEVSPALAHDIWGWMIDAALAEDTSDPR